VLEECSQDFGNIDFNDDVFNDDDFNFGDSPDKEEKKEIVP